MYVFCKLTLASYHLLVCYITHTYTHKNPLTLGHYNHAFFWSEMAPADQAKKTKPSAQLEALINKSFGSLDEFKKQFEARAAPGALFGSGWVWLTVSKDGSELKLVGTANQDNPLMKGAADDISFPILGLDLWEHAYVSDMLSVYNMFGCWTMSDSDVCCSFS